MLHWIGITDYWLDDFFPNGEQAMADELDVRSQEATESGGSAEQAAARKLDDATLEPKALVEQTGDYKQAESIQASFTKLMDTPANSAEDGSAQLSKETSGTADQSGSTENSGFGIGGFFQPVHDECHPAEKRWPFFRRHRGVGECGKRVHGFLRAGGDEGNGGRSRKRREECLRALRSGS